MKKILIIATQATTTRENKLFHQAFQEVDFPCAMVSLDSINFQMDEKQHSLIAFMSIDKLSYKNKQFEDLLQSFTGSNLLLNKSFFENYQVTFLIRRMGIERPVNKSEIEINEYQVMKQFLIRLNKLYYLEHMGIKVINSPQSIEKSMDKIITYNSTNKLSLNCAKRIKTALISDKSFLKTFYEENSKNIVLKQNFGSGGMNIFFLNSENYEHQINQLESMIDQGECLIGQQCIQNAIGDLRILVYKKQVIGAMDRISSEHHKLFNIHQGGTPTSWNEDTNIKKKLFEDAIQITDCIGCDLCGVDFLHDNQDYYFLETNAIPGLTSMENYYFGHEKTIFLEIIKNI